MSAMSAIVIIGYAGCFWIPVGYILRGILAVKWERKRRRLIESGKCPDARYAPATIVVSRKRRRNSYGGQKNT